MRTSDEFHYRLPTKPAWGLGALALGVVALTALIGITGARLLRGADRTLDEMRQPPAEGVALPPGAPRPLPPGQPCVGGAGGMPGVGGAGIGGMGAHFGTGGGAPI